MKTKCPTCDGDGYIWVLEFDGWIVHDTNVIWECKDCDGTGEVEAEEGDDENQR